MIIVPITEDGRELNVENGLCSKTMRFRDLKNAAMFLCGDFLGDLVLQHPNEKIVEFRIKYPSGECFDTAEDQESKEET